MTEGVLSNGQCDVQYLRSMLEAGGLWTTDVAAPEDAELRPFDAEPRARNFPVYPDLADRLLDTKDHPDPAVAHAMAVCAGYSYADAETVSMIMARMGLLGNRCRMISTTADAMLISSNAFLVQSRDGRVVILSYRGTQPDNFIDWMTSADVQPERLTYQFGDPCASVHGGFYRNVRATRYGVMGALGRALQGLSVRRSLDGADEEIGELEALYITGHSLGGAMAAMTAVMLRHERKYSRLAERLKAVYTFGQPMIGDPSFAQACQRDDFLRENVVRYVNDNDPVPHLPPGASGPYRHFGREYAYRVPYLQQASGLLRYLPGCAYQPPRGEWRERAAVTSQMPSALGIALGASMFIGRKFQYLRALPAVYSFEDHLPHRYITALTPEGVSNEFGD